MTNEELEKAKELYAYVKKFAEEQKVHWPESCYQEDRLIVQGMDFMHDTISIVGFKKSEDDEE